MARLHFNSVVKGIISCTMLFVFTILLVATYLYRHFTKYNNYWKIRKIPGPEPNFFFGNIKELFLRQKSAGQIYTDIFAKYPNEKIVGIFRMRTPDLLVKDLEIIKHIMIKDFDLFMDRDGHFSHQRLGANLFHADADTWQLLRNRLTPIFTSGKLKRMMYLIVKSADKLMVYADKIAREQPEQLEVHKMLKKFTQETVATCAFGLDLDCYDKHAETLDNLEIRISKLDYRAELEMMYPGLLKITNWSLMPNAVVKFFSNLAKDIISQRNGEPTDRNDFMDLLLALRKQKKIVGIGKKNYKTKKILEVNDDVIAGEMFIFYLAGYQTTAITMSFMLHHLARNNDIQDKALAEIETVSQHHGNEFSYEALTEMKYMDQVMDETMRMQPIADSVRRIAATDYKVPGTELTVEKGQLFIIPLHVVHMDPTIYPNPEIFDPERFSPENMGQRHSCAFMSFGHGPRKCIGIRFARLQMKICMAKLLARYRVELSKDSSDRFQFESSRLAVFPIGGFPLRLVQQY